MATPRRATLDDQTDISGSRVVIVEARYYDDIQDALLEGAKIELDAAGVNYDILSVPGALEVPAAIAIALRQATAMAFRDTRHASSSRVLRTTLSWVLRGSQRSPPSSCGSPNHHR